MAESHRPSNASSGKDVKAPNVIERIKEEFEAVFHNEKRHHKETHGLNSDIDEDTSVSDVKAPDVVERAKEEIEALVAVIHPKKKALESESKHSDSEHSLECKKFETNPAMNIRTSNLNEKGKEETESPEHKSKSPHIHQKETHGRSSDIDENTPISEVKGPSVFERAKEEIEALIQTIHPKKDSGNAASSPKKGLPESIGRGLEKLCSPRSRNED